VAKRSRRRLFGGTPRGLLLVCVLVVIVVVLPVGVTIAQALEGGISAAVRAIDASSARALLLHSVLVAAVAAPLAGVLGVSGAWFIERTHLPGRRMWTLLAVAPLTIPLFVTSYAWATLWTLLQGFLGAAGIIAVSYSPIVFLLVAVALRGMDPALEESARSLGLSARQTFFRVILPQLRPALLGGMLLVVLDTLVEFDAFVALKYQTFTVHIYAQYELSFSASGAAALSFFSILLCVVLLFGESRLRGGANYTRVSQGVRRPLTRYRLGRTTPLVLAGFALAAAIGVGVPLATLVYWFTQSSQVGLAGASASVHHLAPAALTSLALGVGSALLALVFALPVAFLVVVVARGGVTGGSSLLLYNGQHPQVTSELVAAFEKQTGVKVNVRTNDSIVLADQLLAEGSASPADVYLTENTPELVTLDEHHLLAGLDPSTLAQVPAKDSAASGIGLGSPGGSARLRTTPRSYPPRSYRSRCSNWHSQPGRGRSGSRRPTRTFLLSSERSSRPTASRLP
jgi:ABC-type Fe3+ transport system permease subunit